MEVVSPRERTKIDGVDVVHLMGVLRPRQLSFVSRSLPPSAALVVSPLTQLSVAHMRKSQWKKAPYTALLKRWARSRRITLHGFSEAELVDSQRFLPTSNGFIAPAGVFDPPEVTWRGDSESVAFFGRNDIYQKGIDILLEGYALARTQGFSKGLIVAGQPWKKSDAFLRRNRTEGVEIWGPVDEASKWDLLARARCQVFLSRWDGPPRPVREALSVGCPVLVSHGTNMADMVEQLEAGRAVGSAPEAVAVALRATDDTSRLHSWSKGAIEMRKRLSWAQVAADYESGYEAAVAGSEV